jgi:hypothetical protein
MAQALVDSVTMECMGESTTFKACLVSHVVMEVLGFFQFGTIDIDHLTMEVIGDTAHFAFVDHVAMECMGQWAGF